ncbi:HD-GYP domain-containing protein [Acetobacterium wieringae]|jgi:HD-GYP domain-containing protein (c-di-GMP phosphodiesterase class II)|nr:MULTISPECIES: HD-GYP domain-containing protein [Acetobacterium]MEA4804705.1 HD-GYP domain-containing protein [Acetobacterium wieringae]URN82992.1 HD-GYP domain-containing protein [Acetobacterium wieringae]UYO61369.1 HD-GYP domain-containing protein [Acetobacterium wieringae]
MVVASDLFGDRGELVLPRKTVLNIELIHKIHKFKCNGLFIEEEQIQSIPIVKTIDSSLRTKTVNGIKEIFICKENNQPVQKEQFTEMEDQVETIVDVILRNKEMMLNMVDLKVFDDYTYFHSVNVAVLSIGLGTAMGLDKTDLCNLGFGALLHDIGKVFVPKDILHKQGPLTDIEFSEMKKHSFLGFEYLASEYVGSVGAQAGILDHHEKFSGGGYPNNAKGDKISLYGRIISIADVYDALTSDRPYRKGLLPSEAIEYIMGGTGNLFDPELVRVFVRKIAPYPVGTTVKLSNGLSGIVTDNFESFCMRPNIRIFKNGDYEIKPFDICLADRQALNITVVDYAK